MENTEPIPLPSDEQEKLDGTCAHIEQEYIDIKFQLGPVKEHGINGCQMEDILEILIERLKGFREGPFVCLENALALTKLQEARMWLEERTKNRIARGVEGHNLK